MKTGVRLINCARGGIINEHDLAEALASGKVAGAAFDVFEAEPNTESPLLALDNFIATPHLGASTVEAQRKVSEDICRQVSDYLLKNTIDGALNFPRLEAGIVERYGHFVDLATRLAAVVSRSIKASFETHVKLTVGRGPGSIRFWTSDLTVEYVRFNADYST